MDNLEIAASPKLLARLTQTESDCLTYEQQMERLKTLRKPRVRKVTQQLSEPPF